MNEINVLKSKIKKLDRESCPIEDSKYEWISGQCYFLEKTTMTFDEAKKNCIATGGKLFEPNNMSISKLVWEPFEYKIKAAGKGAVWIGVKVVNSRYVYSSGQRVQFSPILHDRRTASNQCVFIWEEGKWGHYSCTSYKRWSICEL